jgi:hypothetical protein
METSGINTSGYRVLNQGDWGTHIGLRELTHNSDFDGDTALCYFGDDTEVIESLSGVVIEFLMAKGTWDKAVAVPSSVSFPAVDYESPQCGWYLPFLESYSQTRALVPIR